MTDEAWRQPRRLAEFAPLRPAEARLLAERDSGLPVTIGTVVPGADAPPEVRIRASFLRWLILGAEGAEGRTHERGVSVIGAFVESDGPEGAETRGLDLAGCEIARDVSLFLCRFEDRPSCLGARIGELYLDGCRTPGLLADRLETRGGVHLRDGFQSDGEIRLLRARIGGGLDCAGAKLRSAGRPALNADRLTTGGDLFVRHGFESDGELRLLGARIVGDLDCAGAKLRNAGRPALSADGLTTGGGVLFRNGFESDGEVRLLGARIGNNFDCVGAKLRNAGQPALNADGLTTGGGVFFRDGFESDGELRMLGARIDGNLSCVGAKLRNGGKMALSADGLTTGGSVFLRAGFESDGEVRLLGARIGRNLDCGRAKFRNSGGDGLDASGARIEGALFLRQGTAVDGRVILDAAEIGSFNDEPACWPAEISLDRCTYKAFTGRAWSAAERIAWLDKQPAEDGFRPQPWEQCARVLREAGQVEDARAVLIAKEVRQRRARRAQAGRARWAALWVTDAVLGATVRYGRRPLLAAWWLLGFWALGTAVFGAAAAQDAIKPNQPMVLRSPEWVLCGVDAGARVFAPSLQKIATGRRAPGQSQLACWLAAPEAAQYPRFHPLVYSADALLPVVSLEMQGFWLPDKGAGPVGAFARVYLWVHIVAGWGLTLLAVAGFSGIVKSD